MTERGGMRKMVAERLKREGMYVYLWLIHIVIRQNATQRGQAVILQLKIK